MDPNSQAAPSTARVPPAPAGLGPGDLARITSAAADARAPHTRRTYAVQWARFAAWAEARGLPPRPAPPAAVAAYLTARASTAKVATVRLSAAAIGAAHRAAGHPDPTTAPLVRAVIAGIASQHAQHPDTAPRQAAALTYDQAVRLMAGAAQPRRSGRGTEGAAQAAARGRVDAALVALAFCAGLRRSEIAALRWQDVTETAQPDQLRIRVRQSKTNPDGAREDDRLLVQSFAAALTALLDATDPVPTARVIPLSPSQVNRRLQALAASAAASEPKTLCASACELRMLAKWRCRSEVGTLVTMVWRTFGSAFGGYSTLCSAAPPTNTGGRLGERSNEVAAILAHEIAHVESRHSYRIWRNAQRASTVAGIVGLFARGTDNNVDDIVAIMTSFTANLFMAGHGRDREREADLFASFYLTETDVGDRPLLNSLRKLKFARDAHDPFGEGGGGLFATHPHIEERLARAGATTTASFLEENVFQGVTDNGELVATLRFDVQRLFQNELDVIATLSTTPELREEDDVNTINVRVAGQRIQLRERTAEKIFPSDEVSAVFGNDDARGLIEGPIESVELDLRNVDRWERIGTVAR